ncbi:conserved hypothetical protein, partial [Ricinus communis]
PSSVERAGRGLILKLSIQPARLQPGFRQLAETSRHVRYRVLVAHLAGQPATGGIGKDRPSDGKALDRRRGKRRLEALEQLVRRRLEPEQHDTAAPWIIFGNDGVDLLPGSARCLRLELPPVGLDAERVELFHRRRDRIVGQGCVLAGDDLDQQLAADLARGLEQRAQLLLLLRLQFRRIIRVIEAQALDAMVERPFDQLRADILAEFEAQRLGARQFDRAADPGEILGRGIEEGIAAEALVDQHAVAAAVVGNAGGGLDGQPLEGDDLLVVDAEFVADAGQLRTMIDRQRHEKRDIALAGRRPVNVIDRLVLAQRTMFAALGQEEVELGPSRIFGRAEEAGDGEGAAGIRPGGAGLQRLVLQPAAQEAGHERIAGAKH